ncbi:GNAT family N-acetyltransferase [Tepidibacillus infernus]|uniref:GNAT family N-acetyltransferase n=1 Tax=Tepidibacillus infernus TaxID=1806172 RepID=UPI003B729537
MKTFLRNVKEKDIADIFKLSNESYVREYSLNKETIEWDTHVKWFNNLMNSDKDFFYVVTNDEDKFLGQIRFKVKDNEAIVSISLAKEIQGKGLSKILLLESIQRLKQDYPMIKNITAVVSKYNIPSKKLFENAGFHYIGENVELLKYSYKY